MMADLKERGCLEEIALQIPGYAGYLRREARRDADRTARAHLAATLKTARDHVSRAKTARAQAGDLAALAPLETATDRLARLISKVQNADTGYAGFFDSGRIDETLLEQLYQLDLALLAEARAVDEAAAGLGSGEEAARGSLALTERIDRFEREFDRRRSILKGA